MWNIISAERNHYRTFGRDDRSRLNNRAFSHDVTAAMLVFQNNETAAILVSQTNPVGVELFSYANAFFCSYKFAWMLPTGVKTLYRLFSLYTFCFPIADQVMLPKRTVSFKSRPIHVHPRT